MNASAASTAPYWVPPDLFDDLEPEDAAAILSELLETFRVDTARRLNNLRTAVAAGDLSKVRAEAHSIKGSSRQVGAEALAAACQEIELNIPAIPPALLADHANRLEEYFSSACLAMTSYARSR